MSGAEHLIEMEQLPTGHRMALAYLGPAMRDYLAPAFALDLRLGRIIASANEPALAQMRIAWWREILAKPVGERPEGDLVLNQLTKNWLGEGDVLLAMLDGWEELLLAEELNAEIVARVAAGRGAFIQETIRSIDAEIDERVNGAISMRWALADLASHCSSGQERKLILEIAGKLPVARPVLPRSLRGLSVLDALALHSLKQGGRPLGEGRRAALTALKVGLIGG